MLRLSIVGALSFLLLGCGGGEPGSDQAAAASKATQAADSAKEEALADVGSYLAEADVKRGQTMYFQCRACHSTNEGSAHKVGPNLNGMFDRKAGIAEGFAYSDALKNSEIIWTPETMNGWLARPSQYLPGNRMVFVGVKDPQDRANLIAYLQQETGAASE